MNPIYDELAQTRRVDPLRVYDGQEPAVTMIPPQRHPDEDPVAEHDELLADIVDPERLDSYDDVDSTTIEDHGAPD